MSSLQHNKFQPHTVKIRSRTLVPKSFFILGFLVFVIIGINQITFGSISQIFHSIGGPVWKSQAGVTNLFGNIALSFKDKQELQEINKNLQEEINQLKLSSLSVELLRQENDELRGFLNRDDERELIAASILARPNRTLYDTFIIDVGRRDGVSSGARVFGLGDIAIGSVDVVFSRTSIISLYSTPGRLTKVLLGVELVVADAIGQGGGNFEIRIPRGVEILEGSVIFLPEFDGGVLGVVGKIIALPSDSFQRVLFSTPITIQSLRIVTVLLQ